MPHHRCCLLLSFALIILLKNTIIRENNGSAELSSGAEIGELCARWGFTGAESYVGKIRASFWGKSPVFSLFLHLTDCARANSNGGNKIHSNPPSKYKRHVRFLVLRTRRNIGTSDRPKNKKSRVLSQQQQQQQHEAAGRRPRLRRRRIPRRGRAWAATAP